MSQGIWLAWECMTWSPMDVNNPQAVAVSQEKKRVRNRSTKFLPRSCIVAAEQAHLPRPLSGRSRRPFFHINSGFKTDMERDHTAHLCDSPPLLCDLFLKESLARGLSLSESSNTEALPSSSEKELRSNGRRRWIRSMSSMVMEEQQFPLGETLPHLFLFPLKLTHV